MALVDTGSTLTVISKDIANKIKLKIPKSSAISIRQVQGNCKSLGRAKIGLSIGRQTKEVVVHAIEGFSHDLLLGMDTAQKFGMKIDTESKRISIKKHKTREVNNLETAHTERLNKLIDK